MVANEGLIGIPFCLDPWIPGFMWISCWTGFEANHMVIIVRAPVGYNVGGPGDGRLRSIDMEVFTSRFRDSGNISR